MEDFENKAKSTAKHVWSGIRGTAKAAAQELDRQRRVLGVQHEIGDLRHSIDQTYSEIGRQLVALIAANPQAESGLPQEIIPLCQQVLADQEEIKKREVEIEQIRQEANVPEPAPAEETTAAPEAAVPAAPATPAVVAQPPAADLSAPVAALDASAPVAALDASAPVAAPAPPAPPPNESTKIICPNCNSEQTVGTKFCSNCGYKLS